MSTSSTGYTLLLETDPPINDPFYTIGLVALWFTHSAKNEGTTEARGADYEIRCLNVRTTVETVMANFRWTDGLADYKTMSCMAYEAMALLNGGGALSTDTYRFRVYWKVDNASYPAWSKERFLWAFETQRTGKEPIGGV